MHKPKPIFNLTVSKRFGLELRLVVRGIDETQAETIRQRFSDVFSGRDAAIEDNPHNAALKKLTGYLKNGDEARALAAALAGTDIPFDPAQISTEIARAEQALQTIGRLRAGGARKGIHDVAGTPRGGARSRH